MICMFSQPSDRSFARIRTYKAINKQKDFRGILKAYDDKSVTILVDDEEQSFLKSEIALIRQAFDF